MGIQLNLMLDTPLVSIIIRAKNEGKSLITLLPLLYAQKTAFPFEVLLFDNGSNDQTKETSQNYPQLKYNYIPNNSFHFSKSLNDAAKISHGEILVHISAHCFPTSSFWLTRLVKPLIDNSTLIATYGRQFTDPNVNSYEKQDWEELLFPKIGQPKIPTFSNANGAIRKNYLLNHPFDETIPLLEDNLWYLEIPDKTKVIYIPQAELLHLHPLFNLKYYQPRWVKEGIAAVYMKKVKKMESPLTSFNKVNLLFDLRRVLSFFKMGLQMIKAGFVLYGLFAPAFFIIRDYSWMKGLKQGAEIFKVPPSQGGTF